VSIYSPTIVTIRCDSGQSAQIGLGENEVMAIVTSAAFLDRLEHLMPERLQDAEVGVRALKEDRKD